MTSAALEAALPTAACALCDARLATPVGGIAKDAWCHGCERFVCLRCHTEHPVLVPRGPHDSSIHGRRRKPPHDVVAIPVTARARAWAEAEAKKLGVLNNSIERGGGNVAGFIGDAAVAFYTGGRIEHTYDYDVVLPDGRKVDVKTKRTTVEPRADYECSVADYNTTQRCDLYAFVRVREPDLDVAWILGCMTKAEFYGTARMLRKGDVDGSNDFKVKADCYNVFIRDLDPLPRKP